MYVCHFILLRFPPFTRVAREEDEKHGAMLIFANELYLPIRARLFRQEQQSSGGAEAQHVTSGEAEGLPHILGMHFALP